MLESQFNNITVPFCWPLNISYILFWINGHAAPLGWGWLLLLPLPFLCYRNGVTGRLRQLLQVTSWEMEDLVHLVILVSVPISVTRQKHLKEGVLLLAHSYSPAWREVRAEAWDSWSRENQGWCSTPAAPLFTPRPSPCNGTTPS
jgi:hypothetical protein